MSQKFSFSPAAALLSFAVAFIMLSGSMARQCYWCGPLAEQVHESRRAPPCARTAAGLTVCEPSFHYCAVVATSPPYVESRLCVKLYQDECYPLFCNSTKTWRMTCPCRGDLCNGPNTERETEAFAALSKLVARTNKKRSKREITKTEIQLTIVDGEVSTETPTETHKVNVDEDIKTTAQANVKEIGTTVKEPESTAKEPETTDKVSDDSVATTTKQENVETQITKETTSETTKEDNVTVIKAETTPTTMTVSHIDLNAQAQATKMIELDIKKQYPSSIDRLGIYKDEMELQADDPKVEHDKSNDYFVENDKKAEKNDVVNSQTERNKETTTFDDNVAKITSTATETPASITKVTEGDNNDKIRPNEEPSAEAFHQNNTPVNKKVGKPLNAPQNIITTEKPIELTTVSQTETLINEKVVLKSTIAPKNNTKNGAESVAISRNILIIVVCLSLLV